MDMPDAFFTLVRKDDRLGGGLLAMVMRHISPMDIPISRHSEGMILGCRKGNP